MSDHQPEFDQPEIAEVRTEYAFLYPSGAVEPCGSRNGMWNEHVTLHEAAERWKDGASVVSRTVTTYHPTESEWELVTPSGSANGE